ncbi:hypothetical protein CR51_16535 [Caballeronia megalochromosomata]|uniref:response regulator n=1 Tax=Caballeronia sp. LZ029 TaxID=3038564 RepID=UPI0007808B19|nr:hypothetical protein CR51_16535 [Caballeronia megalochromosomata]
MATAADFSQATDSPKIGPPSGDQALLPKVLRILLIEDGLDAREAMRTFLEFEGHAVSAASDGEDGFNRAVTQAYDVLTCAIGLPGMDGIELM